MNWNAVLAAVRALALDAGSLNDALSIGVQYGLLRRLNNDGGYHDTELEMALHARVETEVPSFEAQHRSGVAHILTESYAFGGHTRLAVQWMKLRNAADDQSVVFTRKSDPGTSAAIKALDIPCLLVRGTPIDRITQIIRHCASKAVVVAHIHPEDLIGALALRCLHDRGVSVLFVNHADHVFGFGMSAADTVLEVSGFGWATTQTKRQAPRQSYVGIPLPEDLVASSSQDDLVDNARDRSGPILSVGSHIKYQPAENANFAELLNKLTESVPNDIHLIGPDGGEPWWQDLSPSARRRVRFFGKLPLEETRRHMNECAVYIDSFPLTGGSAFQEAFMLGSPAFGLRIGAGGYGLIDALRSDTIAELVEQITCALLDEPSHGKSCKDDDLRGRIRDEFSDRAFYDRIETALSGGVVALPDELAANAGNLRHFEIAWQQQRPSLAVVPSEVPGFGTRFRLLVILARCRSGHINMSRKMLLGFAAGLHRA